MILDEPITRLTFTGTCGGLKN